MPTDSHITTLQLDISSQNFTREGIKKCRSDTQICLKNVLSTMLDTMQTTSASTTSHQTGDQILKLTSFDAPKIKNTNTKVQLTGSSAHHRQTNMNNRQFHRSTTDVLKYRYPECNVMPKYFQHLCTRRNQGH